MIADVTQKPQSFKTFSSVFQSLGFNKISQYRPKTTDHFVSLLRLLITVSFYLIQKVSYFKTC